MLNRTLISLETSNIYVGQSGTITGVGFIYHGEIENRLMHGIGNCEYYGSGVYNGEFENGKKAGKGVYQYTLGFCL